MAGGDGKEHPPPEEGTQLEGTGQASGETSAAGAVTSELQVSAVDQAAGGNPPPADVQVEMEGADAVASPVEDDAATHDRDLRRDDVDAFAAGDSEADGVGEHQSGDVDMHHEEDLGNDEEQIEHGHEHEHDPLEDEDPDGEEELLYGHARSVEADVDAEQAEAEAVDDKEGTEEGFDPIFAALRDAARGAFVDLKAKHAAMAACITAWEDVESFLDAHKEKVVLREARAVEGERGLALRTKQLDAREAAVLEKETESVQRVQAQRDAALEALESKRAELAQERRRLVEERGREHGRDSQREKDTDRSREKDKEKEKDQEKEKVKKEKEKEKVKAKEKESAKQKKPDPKVKATAPQRSAMKVDGSERVGARKPGGKAGDPGTIKAEESSAAENVTPQEARPAQVNVDVDVGPPAGDAKAAREGDDGENGEPKEGEDAEDAGEEEQVQVEADQDLDDDEETEAEGDTAEGGQEVKGDGLEASKKSKDQPGKDVGPNKELREICDTMDGEGLKRYVMRNSYDAVHLKEELLSALALALDGSKLVLRALESYRPSPSPGHRRDIMDNSRARHARASLLLLEVLEDSLRKEARDAGRPGPAVAASLQKQAKNLIEGWLGLGNGQKGLNPATASPLDAWIVLRTAAVFQASRDLPETVLARFAGAVARRAGAAELLKSVGLGSQMKDIVQKLVSSGQIVDGIMLAHGAGILDELKPAELLRRNLRDMRTTLEEVRREKPGAKGENEAKAKELSALKSMLRCIEQCDLESIFPSEGLQKRLKTLEVIPARAGPSFATKRPRVSDEEMGVRKRTMRGPVDSLSMQRRSVGSRGVTSSATVPPRASSAYARDAVYGRSSVRAASKPVRMPVRATGDRFSYPERSGHVDRMRERDRTRAQPSRSEAGLGASYDAYAPSASHVMVQEPMSTVYGGSSVVYGGSTAAVYSNGLDVGYNSVGAGQPVSFSRSSLVGEATPVGYLGPGGVVSHGELYGGSGIRDRYASAGDIGQSYASTYGR